MKMTHHAGVAGAFLGDQNCSISSLFLGYSRPIPLSVSLYSFSMHGERVCISRFLIKITCMYCIFPYECKLIIKKAENFLYFFNGKGWRIVSKCSKSIKI